LVSTNFPRITSSDNTLVKGLFEDVIRGIFVDTKGL
jgi:hypothetical protein